MASSLKSKHRRQIRSFVLVWGGVTFVMASVTFIAIYMTYGSQTPLGTNLRNVAIPQSTTQVAQVPPVTITPRVATTAEATESADGEALSVPEPTATPRPIDVRRFQVGTQIQVSFDLMDQWMNVASTQLDVNWAKMQVRWENMETEQDNYDWLETDLFLPAAQQHNVHVLLSVVTAPEWAREQGVDVTRHGPPANTSDYVDFVTTMVERYPGMIGAIEVWNEQNLDREWTSTAGLSAARYVELLGATYNAVKAIDPGIIIVSGALSPTGLSDGVRAWDDFTYMDQMIEAGLLDVTDCVGAHHNGYNIGPSLTWDNVPNDPTAQFRGPFPAVNGGNPHHSWSFRSTLQTYASKIELAGGDQKLCVTEFGWASGEDLQGVPEGLEFAYDNTLAEQRDYTVEALDNMQDWDIVWLAFLWNLNYGPQAGWSPDNENVPYSIIGPNTTFRPVFDAVRDWNRAYEAQFE